ncbi:Inner membrane protein, fragmented [Serratia marcescens SMB2099]|nr:Inner membrane protein, fragmented [Serratia marcescens SMB2099]
MLFNCPISQCDPRLAAAVANKMGPSNPASRGKAKKISFFYRHSDHCFRLRGSL